MISPQTYVEQMLVRIDRYFQDIDTCRSQLLKNPDGPVPLDAATLGQLSRIEERLDTLARRCLGLDLSPSITPIHSITPELKNHLIHLQQAMARREDMQLEVRSEK